MLTDIIKDAAESVGVPYTADVVSSSDLTMRQMLALANIELKSLLRRHQWSVLITETTFVSVAAESQGALTDLAPGFQYLVNETIYDRTRQRKIHGPLTSEEWQILKSSNAVGPFQNYRIQSGDLYFYPEISAGNTVALEYMSKYPISLAAGGTKEKFTLNDDSALLDEWLVTLGVIWRFLRAKGLDFAEEFRTYEIEVNNAIARDGGRKTLRLESEEMKPGIFVPEGNWFV